MGAFANTLFPATLRSVSAKGLHAAAAIVLVASLAGCTKPEEKARKYYESGQTYLQNKDYVRAGLEFRNALKLKKDYADAWYGMAQVEEADKNWSLVAGDLNKALEINPNHLAARTAYARMMVLAGNNDQALSIIEKGLELNPDDIGFLTLKAAALLKMKRTQDAVDFANKALAKDPKNLDAMLVLASERLNANDLPGAQAQLDKALAAAPDAVGARLFALALYEKTGDVKSQEDTLRAIAKSDPSQAGYQKALITFLVQQKRYDEAEKEMRALAASKPDDVDVNMDLVRFLGSFPGKGPDAAMAELKRLMDTSKDPGAYRRAYTQALIQLGKGGDAVALLRDSIAKEGISDNGIQDRLQLATALMQLGKTSEAEKPISEVLTNDAKNVDGLRLRAAMKIANGSDLESAAADLREALNEAPGNPQLYQMMGVINERNGSIELADKSMGDAFRVSKFDANVGMDYARFLLRHGKAEHAESVLTDLNVHVPNNAGVLSMLADLKLQRQDWAGAQDLAQKAGEQAGLADLSKQISAASLVGQNKIDDGVRVLLGSDPNAVENDQTKFTLVKTYLKSGKFKEAEDYLTTILKSEPKNADAQVYLGLVQMNTNRDDEAKATLEAVIAQNPAASAGYAALADLAMKQNKPGDAANYLKDGISKAQSNVDLRFALASMMQDQGDIDDAIAQYQEILKQQPGSMLAANNYASLVSDFRNDPQSVEAASKAAAILRGSPIAQFRDTLGWILHLRGQQQEAVELLKQSAADLPDVLMAQYHLGATLAAAGDKAGAKVVLEKAVLLKGSEKEVALAKAALAGL